MTDMSTNTTTTTSLTAAQARQIARWLQNNGSRGIQIVECYPDGHRFVKFLNRCNMNRLIHTMAEFNAHRDGLRG